MLNMMIQCVALEVAYFNVRINGVAPGVTDTPATREKIDLQKESINIPL